jgi:hypothetical protein
MLASEVIAICDRSDSNGIGELARLLSLSRRQAEAFAVQARRAVAGGHDPIMVPGTVVGPRAALVSATASVDFEPDDQDQGGDDLEHQAHAQARRIKHESAGVAGASIANLRSRLATLERNVRAGYGAEWDYDLRLTRRTLELVEVPV